MAQKTNLVASFANGLVNCSVVYNDATLKITSSVIVNNSDFPAHLDALLNPPINGFSIVGVDCPAHSTVTPNFPNNVVSYTSVTDPDTGQVSLNLVGVVVTARWPA